MNLFDKTNIIEVEIDEEGTRHLVDLIVTNHWRWQIASKLLLSRVEINGMVFTVQELNQLRDELLPEAFTKFLLERSDVELPSG